MADDMFGDSSLFEEFDKEREASGSFIFYETDEHGSEDRSKIHFQLSESESSSDDSDDDDGSKSKVKDLAVGKTVETLKKQEQKHSNDVNDDMNGIGSDGESAMEDGEDNDPIVTKERLAKSTMFKLTHERNKYKRFCNIIDSTRFLHDEKSPAVQIIYQNNAFSRKHKTEIEDYIKQLLVQDTMREYETLQKLDLKSTVPSCSDLNDKIPIAKRTNKMFQAHSIIGCSQLYQQFILDTLGWPLVEYNPSLTESWDLPIYEQMFEDSLPIDIALVRANELKKEKERSKPKCWNCGGDHMMTECKLPRNQQNINEARQAMMADKAQRGPTGPKSARYHKETSVDPKYQKFKPGSISTELQEALGLSADQLPVYIYKMRSLGYPPGWMEDAKTQVGPGLSMFDKDGNDDDADTDTPPAAPQLDVTKIIEYPGFTVEADPNVIEEASMYGLPPLQPHQLKATLLAHTQIQQQAAKREQEQQDEQQQSVKRAKLDTSDMDLDDVNEDSNSSFLPPLPPDTPPCKPPIPDCTPPPTPVEGLAGQRSGSVSRESSATPSDTRSGSPSLEELEEKYKLLQKNLMSAESIDVEDGELIVLDSCDDDTQSSIDTGMGDVSANPIDIDSQDSSVGDVSGNPVVLDDSIDNSDAEFVRPKMTRTGSTTSIQTFGELGTGSPSCSLPGTPLHTPFVDKPTFKGSLSVSKDYGTPILKRPVSVEYLPEDKNFAQGIEEHIPFENLPDSTGTFEKMRKLITKIREKVPNRKKKS